MLPINASRLRVPANDATALLSASNPNGSSGPNGTFSPNGSSDPTGFSALLRQSQADAARKVPAAKAPATSAKDGPRSTPPEPEPAPTATSAPDHAAEARAGAVQTAGSEAAAGGRAAIKAKPRDDTAATQAQPSAPDATASDVTPGDKAAAAAPANPAQDGAAAAPSTPAAAPALVDPSVAQWLAARQGQASTAPAPGDASTQTDAAAPAPVDPKSGGANAASASVGPDPADKAADTASRFATEAQAACLVAAVVEPHAAEARASAPVHASATGAEVTALPPPPVPIATHATAAAVSVAVATPVNAPDFAQTLGVQLSLLAKNGVQHAELHLNPADMGPVSVRIAMDGTQARVDFGADAAATRQAIETGLPELASALRDAGFTLCGGGVSQHAGSRGDGDGDGGGSNGGQAQRGAQSLSDASIARVSAAARRIVTQGGVDLYA
jgi:flagellar hook-length control protein FliK